MQTVLILLFSFQPGGTLNVVQEQRAQKVFQSKVEIQYKQDGKQIVHWLDQDQFVSLSIMEIGNQPDYRKLQLNGIRLMADLPLKATLLRVRTTTPTHDLILLFDDFQQAKSFAQKIIEAMETT